MHLASCYSKLDCLPSNLASGVCSEVCSCCCRLPNSDRVDRPSCTKNKSDKLDNSVKESSGRDNKDKDNNFRRNQRSIGHASNIPVSNSAILLNGKQLLDH